MQKCQANNKDGTDEPNDCMINWYGGSGAMEAAVVLDLCVDVYTSIHGRIFIETIVSDGNITMRSYLTHAENGGKLQDHIPEQELKANPSHRIKVMAGLIFKLVKDTKKSHESKKIDAIRVKKYIGCYIHLYGQSLTI